MAGYHASFEKDSYAQYAAMDADAAAEAPHALVPPPIELTTDFALAQQARFEALAAEGRPGATELQQVYAVGEGLVSDASDAYDTFVGSARFATGMVVRFDALQQMLDQDGDLATNFVLDTKTQDVTTEALQARDLNKSSDSLTGAMTNLSTKRTALVAAAKRARQPALRARSATETAKADAAGKEKAAIEDRIDTFANIAALGQTGVKAVMGGDVAGAVGTIAKGAADLGDAGIDPTSVKGAAKACGQLYYAKELVALEHQIKAATNAAKYLEDEAVKAELQAVMLELEVAREEYAAAAKSAQDALDDRRKRFAEAGREIDRDERSAGAEEGEVSDSLLLGSSATEAQLLLASARADGDAASTAVEAARDNARERGAFYQTKDTQSEIGGRQHYLTRGVSDKFADDPDYTALYGMSKAIQKWQDAATQAATHLDTVAAAFSTNIMEPAGGREY